MKCTRACLLRLKIVFVVMILAMVHAQALAATVRMSWNANNDSSLLGYKVYYGHYPHVYSTVLSPIYSTSVDIGDLKAGSTYYMAVTAYNADGESDFSDEVSVTIPNNADAGQNLQSDGTSSSGGGGGGCFIVTACQ
jgi:hypothetical protein